MMSLKDRIEEVGTVQEDDTLGFIVSVHVKQFVNSKSVAQMSNEAAEQHKAKASMIKVRVDKLEKTALAPWGAVTGRASKLIKDHTVPYGRVKNQHFLPIKNLDVFMKDAHELEVFAGEQRKTIEGLWEAEIERAEKALGDLFNPGDYPDVHQVYKHFICGVSLAELPKKPARPKSILLTEEQVDMLTAKMEADKKDAEDSIASGIYERIMDPVGKMVERLSKYKHEYDENTGKVIKSNKFHNSLVDNIEEVISDVESFNIYNDPQVTELVAEIKSNLIVAPDQLRTSAHDRRKTLLAAEKIMQKMADLI